jgi:hypothetical protein
MTISEATGALRTGSGNELPAIVELRRYRLDIALYVLAQARFSLGGRLSRNDSFASRPTLNGTSRTVSRLACGRQHRGERHRVGAVPRELCSTVYDGAVNAVAHVGCLMLQEQGRPDRALVDHVNDRFGRCGLPDQRHLQDRRIGEAGGRQRPAAFVGIGTSIRPWA